MAWQYDPSLSKVEWAIDYLGIATVKGLFKKVQATVNLDDPDPSNWSVEATIETASLTGGHDPMDDHARSADFLDVERFPTATFKSRQVERSNGRYRVVADLTLHGVTREVVLDATYGGEANGHPRAHEARIQRTDHLEAERLQHRRPWHRRASGGGRTGPHKPGDHHQQGGVIWPFLGRPHFGNRYLSRIASIQLRLDAIAIVWEREPMDRRTTCRNGGVTLRPALPLACCRSASGPRASG